MNVETIFDLLDCWRNYPNYQLERRADIYFAYYLPTIINKKLEENIDYKHIIPEFPLLYDKTKRSKKVDYAIFGKKYLYFVELKTNNHFNTKQDIYLKNAQKKRVFLCFMIG